MLRKHRQLLQKLMAALQDVSGSKSQGEGPPPPPPPALNAGTDGGPLAPSTETDREPGFAKRKRHLLARSATTSAESSTSTATTAAAETANTDLSKLFQ